MIRVQQNGFAAQYSSPMIVQDETCQLIYQPEETSQLSFHPVNCGTIQLGEIKLEEDIFWYNYWVLKFYLYQVE